MTRSTLNRLRDFLTEAIDQNRMFGWVRPRPAIGQRSPDPGPGGDCALLAFRKENGPAELSGHEIDAISDANDRSKGNPLAVFLAVNKLHNSEIYRCVVRV